MKELHQYFRLAMTRSMDMSISKEPTWFDDVKIPKYPRLESDASADVCIVGGGLTGVTAAYLLARAGASVTLIEKDRLGSGATGYTTAFITSVIDTDMADLVENIGLAKARKVIDSHRKAIDTIEGIVKKEKISCDFMRCDNMLFAADSSQTGSLDDEFAAARKLGFDAARIDSIGIAHEGAFAIKDQAKFHPLTYLFSVARAAKSYGARIFEHTEATELREGEVCTKHGKVAARHILLATYEPFNKPLSLYFKKAFYDTYMYAGTVKRGAIPEGIYEDLSNPYQYFRIDAGTKTDRFVFGGMDHRSDVKVAPSKNFKALKDYIDEHFGDIEYAVENKWTGGILESIDGFPFIGPFGKSAYVAMAFSGNGMTYATIAAEMFRDSVMGNGSPWTRVYDPSRIPDLQDLLVKGRDYLGEFFGGAVHNAVAYRKK